MNMQEYISSEKRRRTILLGIIKSPQVCQVCMLSDNAQGKKNLIFSLPLGALISLKQSSVSEIPMWPYLMLCVCCVCMCVRQEKKKQRGPFRWSVALTSWLYTFNSSHLFHNHPHHLCVVTGSPTFV